MAQILLPMDPNDQHDHFPQSKHNLTNDVQQVQQRIIDAWLVSRITDHVNHAVSWIMYTTNDVQMRQQRLIRFLMDVLQEQPDETVIDLIVGALDRHGISSYRSASQSLSSWRGGRKASEEAKERCLVQLGPIALELENKDGYYDLLCCADGLCQLKHSAIDTIGEKSVVAQNSSGRC